MDPLFWRLHDLAEATALPYPSVSLAARQQRFPTVRMGRIVLVPVPWLRTIWGDASTPTDRRRAFLAALQPARPRRPGRPARRRAGRRPFWDDPTALRQWLPLQRWARQHGVPLPQALAWCETGALVGAHRGPRHGAIPEMACWWVAADAARPDSTVEGGDADARRFC